MRVNLPVTQREHTFPADQTLVSVTDLQGRITYCNAAFVHASGYTHDELLGQPHNLVRHPDMPSEAFRDLWSTIQSGRPWVGLVKNRRKDGDHYWVQANAIPIRKNGSTEILGFLSVRTCPSREAVQQAEALYARLRAQAESGRGSQGLCNGRVVRTGALGLMKRGLGLVWRGPSSALQWAAAGGCVALGASAPGPWALAGAAVLAVLANHAIRIQTLRPFLSLRNSLDAMAAGDLSAPVETGAHGLLGRLQMSLNQLRVNVRTVIADTHTEIANLRGAIQEIASGNTELSTRTETQARNLQETASSTEQINGTARQSAEAVTQAAQLANDMAAQAQRSQASVQQVSQSMADINQASQRMGDIIHVIEGVAFQTNILALNAAVEAARAGEAGRGFAVVATEVRSLAQRTTEAAHEIRQLIGESIERVATGNDETSTATSRMNEALTSVEQVATLLRALSGTALEQQQGVAQIGSAMTQIEQITQQNAAMVEELAASTEGLQQQVAQAGTILGLLRLHPGDRTLAEVDAVALRRAAKARSQQDDEFDFRAAINAHGKWKTTLRNAINNGEQLDAAKIGRDDCCPLGKWAHGPGGQRWGTQPDFVSLVQRHKAFHEAAGAVAQAVNRGDKRQALQMLEGGSVFVQATQAVVAALNRLRQTA